jgi:hypothetical protein
MNKQFNINNQTSLKYDECVSTDKYNEKMFQHYFQPMALADAKHSRQSYLNSTDVNGILQDQNFDGSGKFINQNTNMRFGKMTEQEGRKELPTRLFIGAPLMSTGQSELKNTDLSSRLKYSEDTRVKKSASNLSGLSIDNFIPLVPNIADNIQNPEHIIPEYWVRGGMNSRSVHRNINYLRSCGKQNS